MVSKKQIFSKKIINDDSSVRFSSLRFWYWVRWSFNGLGKIVIGHEYLNPVEDCAATEKCQVKKSREYRLSWNEGTLIALHRPVAASIGGDEIEKCSPAGTRKLHNQTVTIQDHSSSSYGMPSVFWFESPSPMLPKQFWGLLVICLTSGLSHHEMTL